MVRIRGGERTREAERLESGTADVSLADWVVGSLF